MAKPAELLDFVASNGTVYPLHSPPSRVILELRGWGKPGDTFQTATNPYQHGETPLSYRLTPRTINCTLRHKWGNREDYWTGRSQLLSQLGINNASPNAPLLGTLRRKYYENSLVVTRAVDVFLKSGLAFENPQDRAEFSVTENLEFIAYNPIVYDPALKTSTISTFTASLILPMTFPFILGSYYGSSTITYIGTWESYPLIEITGPASGVFIRNVTLGTDLHLNYTISAGEVVSINLGYDYKTAVNNFGDNLAGYLRDSDLNEFCIQHSKIVSGGTNVFLVALDGYGTNTSIVLKYYNRYYGI